MEVEPIGSVPSQRRPDHRGHRGAGGRPHEAPPGDPVRALGGRLAEAQRLQTEEHMPPLAALQAVYAKLASGWLPPISR